MKNSNIIIKTLALKSFWLTLVLALSLPPLVHAELEELDDVTLDEQTGKEGITIDLSFKLSIGQVYFNYHDKEAGDDNRYKGLTPPPPRIEYGHIKNK